MAPSFTLDVTYNYHVGEYYSYRIVDLTYAKPTRYQLSIPKNEKQRKDMLSLKLLRKSISLKKVTPRVKEPLGILPVMNVTQKFYISHFH